MKKGEQLWLLTLLFILLNTLQNVFNQQGSNILRNKRNFLKQQATLHGMALSYG